MAVEPPFNPRDWAKLLRALSRDDSRAGIVLYVEARTGLRVGDLLELDRDRFRKAFRTAELQLKRQRAVVRVPFDARAWKRLKSRWRTGQTIAEWLCPDCAGDPANAGYGAYRQLDRHLKEVGARLELSGRIHLQRLRRTVAARAFEKGETVNAVKRKLGHRSAQATSRYRSRRAAAQPR